MPDGVPLQLIPCGDRPENCEVPLAGLAEWQTPSSLVFRRSHSAPPELDSRSWRLSVEGLVAEPLELGLEALRALPRRTVTVTSECAGNGRALLEPRPAGVPWRSGGVSTVEWSGIPLLEVLQRAGIREGAREVVAVGADSAAVPKAPGEVPFARSIPLAKALHPDTLLADRMNGEPLTREHGCPLRLVVPGWYGVASVKWLRRLQVVEQPFAGYYQAHDYVVWEATPNGPELRPITGMTVKSVIVTPAAGETVRRSRCEVRGTAWAGERTVIRVEVSADGGATWEDAELIDPPRPYCWRRWSWSWKPRMGGPHTLMSRATDDAGNVQPAAHDPGRAGYMVNFTVPVPVRVLPLRRAAADAAGIAAVPAP